MVCRSPPGLRATAKNGLKKWPTPPVVALVKVSVALTLAEESLREAGGIYSVTRRHSRDWRPCSVATLRFSVHRC